METPVFKFVEVEEVHGKFRLYLRESGHYLASFNYQREAINAATVVDRALLAKKHEHLVTV